MVKRLLLAGGAIGILLPDGSIIYPKDGPVDPDSRSNANVGTRSDIAVGLAMRVLTSRNFRSGDTGNGDECRRGDRQTLPHRRIFVDVIWFGELRGDSQPRLSLPSAAR
jgi:hypothetical protein